MIFLGNLTSITDSKCNIGMIHYLPFDEEHGLGKSREELEREGILVDDIPEPDNNGKMSTLYCNPNTKELWYEYEDIPKSKEELQTEKVEQLEFENANLFLNNALQESRLTGLEEENASILFELATIKGGI